MPLIEAPNQFVVLELHDEDNVLVETYTVPGGFVLEVPVSTQTFVFEVAPPPDVVVEEVLEPLREVLELGEGVEVVEATVVGPQGPPGDTKFHVGPTPPADTTLIWVDTSAA